jgi:hypothetical protein
MPELNETAKAMLRDAGITEAEWDRANYGTGSNWTGDACGCPDSRCIGFHHFHAGDCGCLPVLIDQYLSGEGLFAERPAGKDGSDDG